MNTNSTDRRTALGVFFKAAAMGASVPVIAATMSQCSSQPAHSATIDRGAWARLVAAELGAHKTMEEYWGPNVGDMLMSDPRYAANEAHYNGLSDAHDEAFFAMLNMPAPDAKALAHKLQRIQANDGYGLDSCYQADIMPVLISDALRLAGEA